MKCNGSLEALTFVRAAEKEDVKRGTAVSRARCGAPRQHDRRAAN